MGVYQEVRMDAPHPEIVETEYGAKTVKAATETPIVDENVLSESTEEENEEAAPVVEPEPEKPAQKEKKKSGRPKKVKK